MSEIGAPALAVRVALIANGQYVRFIRKAGPRSFGFDPSSDHPNPAIISEAAGEGSVRSGIAGLLGIRTSIWTMTLQYGDALNPSTTFIQVISDFHRDIQEARPVEEELARLAGGDLPFDLTNNATRVEQSSKDLQITVQREVLRVSAQSEANVIAFQFNQEGVLVTVVARNPPSRIPDFARLTDLEPFLAPLEHLSYNDIAARLASRPRPGGGRWPDDRS